MGGGVNVVKGGVNVVKRGVNLVIPLNNIIVYKELYAISKLAAIVKKFAKL